MDPTRTEGQGPGLRDRALGLVRDRGVVSMRRLSEEGIPRYLMARLADEGEVERVGRGYYGDPRRLDLGSDRAAAVADKAVLGQGALKPVVVLQTAAVIHGLTTDLRVDGLWLAIRKGARPPRSDAAGIPVHVVHMQEWLLVADTETVEFGGREVLVTTRPRTLVDLYRYSSVARPDGGRVVERHVAEECLRKALQDGLDPDEVRQIAQSIPRSGRILDVLDGLERQYGRR